MKEINFYQFLSNYLADVVHDIQNYTITIALGKESLWSLIKNYVTDEEDQNNIQNFLRIIENSNNKINDIAYLINAIRVFFEGDVHLHRETIQCTSVARDIINRLNYKFSPSKYDVIFEPGQIDSEETLMDKESFKYLLTIMIKILKMERPGHTMLLTMEKDKSHFQMELCIKDDITHYKREIFQNASDATGIEKETHEFFLKAIHFFVIDKIANYYNGAFFISKTDTYCNGLKISLNFS